MSVTVFPTPSSGSSAQTLKTDIITSTQSWTAPIGVTKVDVFIVSGGGGGGGAYTNTQSSGGGGGGGQVVNQILSVTPGTSYTVTIGAGGSGGSGPTGYGGIGSSSSFGSLLTVLGGGGGASGNQTPSYGTMSNAGGMGIASSSYAGGSGGGSGFFNVAYHNSQSSMWSPTPYGLKVRGSWGYNPSLQLYNGNPGLDGFGAGGGGGYPGAISIAGGLNAGDGANFDGNATSGKANFGGGGGGATYDNNSVYRSSGSGGSGVCIIRYWS